MRGMGVVMCRFECLRSWVGRSERGQSSVEYVLVMIAFLSMVLALGSLWHAGRDGALLNQAVEASSHQLGGSDALGSMRDIALF